MTGSRGRRVATVLVMVALAVAAGAAAWRSLPAAAPTAETVAAGLRCPSCQGQSVADSRSPVAAAMREVISAQLSAGRSPDQIRGWFVDRYGPEVLGRPPARGTGVLLWVLPGAVLLLAAGLAWRAARRPPAEPLPGPTAPARPRRALPTRRVWDLVAVGLVGMVAMIALLAPTTAGDGSGGAPAADPVAAELALGRSLEDQGRFAEAAQVYRSVYAQRPGHDIRLRLSYALVRAGQPAEAIPLAGQVVAARPADADALLVLGLAQRAADAPEAPATLRRFLEAAPDHPAASQVRRLLDQP